MTERALDWCNILGMPLLAGIFASDIYLGKGADLAVWLFAFLGLTYTFLHSARSLLVQS